MKYSIQIHSALTQAVNALGDYGQSKFAEKTQISPVYINRWLNPEKYNPKIIGDELWKKLYPHISKYLSQAIENNELPKKNENNQVDSVQVPDYVAKLFSGQINVYGVPIQKVQDAIRESSLTDEQKKELILKIFS